MRWREETILTGDRIAVLGVAAREVDGEALDEAGTYRDANKCLVVRGRGTRSPVVSTRPDLLR